MTLYSSPIKNLDTAMLVNSNGDQSNKDQEPLRRCFVSGAQLPKPGLLRFIVDPSGTVVFDAAGKLPGRGLWLKAERDMIDTAWSKRLFSKAARQTVEVPDGLAEMVAASLKRRCLDRLGLARRAGLVSAGYEKVRAEVGAGRAALLLQAADGSANSRHKIAGFAPNVPVIDLFTGAELGQAIGRVHVVHVAIGAGRLVDDIRIDAGRYNGIAALESKSDDN